MAKMTRRVVLPALLVVAIVVAIGAAIAVMQSTPRYVAFILQIVDASEQPIPYAEVDSTPWDYPSHEAMDRQFADENGRLAIPKALVCTHTIDICSGDTCLLPQYELQVTKEMDGGTVTVVAGGE